MRKAHRPEVPLDGLAARCAKPRRRAYAVMLPCPPFPWRAGAWVLGQW